MKITLAVLFLAGLTIYCKCTAVLSLPPSLIARAASLERTETATTATDDHSGDGGGGEGGRGAGGGEDAGTLAGVSDVDGVGVASELLNNFKNLWHKNFALEKRERNAFEDGIAAVVAAPQQLPHQQLLHQPLAAIKNNKNDLQQLANIAQQQQQYQLKQHQAHDNGNNKYLKLKSSASNSQNPTNEAGTEHHQMPASAEDYGDDAAAAVALADEYDSNEWLAPSSKMTDDIIVSPPSLSQLATIEEAANDDGDDYRRYDGYSDEDVFESPEIAVQLSDIPPLTFDDSRSAAATPLDDEPADSMVWSKILRPLKYWAKQCQTENENNCPPDYYRALNADRNNNVLQQNNYQQTLADLMEPPTTHNLASRDTSEMLREFDDYSATSPIPETLSNDDILLLLTAEQKLVKFLTWAMAELYPFGMFSNVSEDGADHYHPGMYLWKKLNLSGRLEPPLLVDEPRYVIVRREFDPDEEYKRTLHFRDDPFIPPRGRKHNLPDLDALLQRYETFVPNRGRRGDRIKDIFKYDDLFYPNRGKRQMTLESSGIGAAAGGGGGNNDIKANQQIINGENAAEVAAQQLQLHQHPLTKTLEHIQNVMAKMKRKLHQMQRQQSLANSFDEMSRNKPTARMSTTYQRPQEQRRLLNKRLKSMANILQQQRRPHLPNGNKNFNSRRQWWKRYSTTTTASNNRPASSSSAAATVRSRTAAANRLHALRSMSPLQQLPAATWQQQHQDSLPATEYLSPPRLLRATKFMSQQQQQQHQEPTPLSSSSARQSLAQQFDPLSWHKLQMLQHQYHLPILTMRQPRLAAAVQHRQHPAMMMRQHQQQLATPQETQLSSYSSDPTADNSVANGLKNLFNTDCD